MNDKIVSLCYVNSKGDKTTELCRIADYIDGGFLPYRFDPSNEFYGEERDLLYGLTSFLQVDEGDIAVFEWSVYLTEQNKWFTETSKSDQPWIEVIFTKSETVKQLVEELKKGYPMNKFDRQHDLVLCCSSSGNQCEAIYISKTDAFCRDGKLIISDDVVSLFHVRIDARYGIGDCRCRSSRYDTRKYLCREDECKVVGTIEFKSRDEIIGAIIRQNISKDGLGRKERQAARLALEKITMPSIIELISTRLQCSERDAEKYAVDYVSRAKEKLETTSSQRLIELLIENDGDSVQRMRSVIQKEWNETQYKQIEAAQQLQAEATRELDSIKARIGEEKERLQKLQDEQHDAEAKTQEAKALREQVETEINKRLEEFRNDYASVLVRDAVISATSVSMAKDTGNSSNVAKWSIILHEFNATEGKMEDNYDEAVEYWIDISANQDMAQELATVSFAAYASKIPLLIIGEGAVVIADVISATICGQTSIKLSINDDVQDFEETLAAISKAPEAVICVINGLRKGYDNLRTLMQLCPQRMFVITEMHAESLIMEPRSMFATFLPVFCDYFFTGGHIEELPKFTCSTELQQQIEKITARGLKEARAIVSQWFSDGFYPRVLYERTAKLIATINHLCQVMDGNSKRVEATIIEFIIVPIMKCMQRERSLEEHLEECGVIDNDRKATIMSFVNVGD